MPRAHSLNTVLLATISMIALSACSGSSRHAKSEAPMPPISEMDAAMSAPAPLPLSESDTLTPVMETATASPTAIGASESPADIEARMAKLEQSVSSLQGDYNKIMPAFATLNTTNARIQTLLGEIEKETGVKTADLSTPPPMVAANKLPPETVITTTSTTVPATGVVPPAGAVSKADGVTAPVTAGAIVTTTTTSETVNVPPSSAPPLASFKEQPSVEEARAEAARQTGAGVKTASVAEAAPSTGATTVKGVRIGEHGSKTRLVVDLNGSAKPDFKYDIDNGEKVLVVDLPSSGWAGAESGSPKSPMIAGWNVQKGAGGGSMLAVQLKKSARVVSSEFLKPEGASPARIVLDIASGE